MDRYRRLRQGQPFYDRVIEPRNANVYGDGAGEDFISGLGDGDGIGGYPNRAPDYVYTHGLGNGYGEDSRRGKGYEVTDET